MKRQAGFTLLEVMVALAIMAAIAIALSLLVSQVLDAREQLHEVRAEGTEQLVDFLTRVDHQLSQLVVRRAHERGQPLNTQVLDLQNNNREFYWVAAGQWVLPLGDYATRLRLWRLNWNPDDEVLLLESSGFLDSAEAQQWTEVDRLTQVTELDWGFWRQGGWQNTLSGDFPQGLRLNLTWKGTQWHRVIVLPEVFLQLQGSSTSSGNNASASEGTELQSNE